MTHIQIVRAVGVLALLFVLAAAVEAKEAVFDFRLAEPLWEYEYYGEEAGYGFTVSDPDSCLDLTVTGSRFTCDDSLSRIDAAITKSEKGLGVASDLDCNTWEMLNVNGNGKASSLAGDEMILFEFDPAVLIDRICFDWVDPYGCGPKAGDSVKLYIGSDSPSVLDIKLSDHDLNHDGLVDLMLADFLSNPMDRFGIKLGIIAPDCNDNFTVCGLKVEVDCVPPPPVVPLPASSVAGLMMLGGMSVWRSIRRKRQADI